MFISAMATLATLVWSVSAKENRTFAVNHFYGKGPLVEGRMDPIVNPGVASSHSHTIQGGNAFALTLSDTQLLDSTCTSSLIKNDRSAYWTPSLYFQDPTNGSFISVPMFYMNVYYFFEATDDEIKAFPTGLRMVVGNTALRTPPDSGGMSITDANAGTPQPVQWTCPRSNYDLPAYPPNSDGLHGSGIEDPNNEGAGVGFPDINCDGYASPLRADIHFPSCYNPSAGLDDYGNNMVWPTSKDTTGDKQNCPPGYIHTPHIFYEVYWNTPLFVNMWTQGQGTQPFVLSNGDNTGYSLHGDFISGWDEATLQQIIDNCDAGDSGMDKCPGIIGGINDPSTSCNIASPIQEQISGVLSALPGNNPVTGWGVRESPPPASSGSSSAAPAASSSSPTAAKGSSSYSAAAAGGYSVPSTFQSSTPLITPGGFYATSTASGSVVWSSFPTNASSSSTPIPSTPTGWTYKGCFSDDQVNRALTGKDLKNLGAKNLTSSGCVAACSAAGFRLAGIEHGGQCFCGDGLADSSKSLPDSACAMVCEGDAGEVCGRPDALTVYAMKQSECMAKRHLNLHEAHPRDFKAPA